MVVETGGAGRAGRAGVANHERGAQLQEALDVAWRAGLFLRSGPYVAARLPPDFRDDLAASVRARGLLAVCQAVKDFGPVRVSYRDNPGVRRALVGAWLWEGD